MKIEFEVPDELIGENAKKQFVSELQRIVNAKVVNAVQKYTHEIEQAVDLHLSRRITDMEIKGLIDKAVLEKLSDLDRL